MRTEYGFERLTCGCRMCQIPCENMPGMLAPPDIEPMAKHLGYADVSKFAAENLLASPGATIMYRGRVIQLPTLVPDRQENGVCKFYKDGQCSVHEVAPYGCAFMDMHNRYEDRMIAAFVDIKDNHANEGDYSLLWYYLHGLGRHALPATEGRRRITEAMKKEGFE